MYFDFDFCPKKNSNFFSNPVCKVRRALPPFYGCNLELCLFSIRNSLFWCWTATTRTQESRGLARLSPRDCVWDKHIAFGVPRGWLSQCRWSPSAIHILTTNLPKQSIIAEMARFSHPLTRQYKFILLIAHHYGRKRMIFFSFLLSLMNGDEYWSR